MIEMCDEDIKQVKLNVLEHLRFYMAAAEVRNPLKIIDYFIEQVKLGKDKEFETRFQLRTWLKANSVV